MKTRSGSDWVSVFLFGALAIVLSWATSGCLIGNRVENQPKSDSDPYSGYYVLEPRTLIFSTSTQSGILQKSASLSLIPQQVGKFLTNPLLLYLRNLDTGSAGLTAPALASSDNPPHLPITVNKDFTISFSGTSSSSTYWMDPDCQSKFDLLESGKISKDPSVSNPPGNTLKLSGELQLTLQLVNHLTGHCDPTLQAVASCYQDVTHCGGSTSDENDQIHTQVLAIFSPYIQSGALTLTDLPTLTEYAYEVSYQ